MKRIILIAGMLGMLLPAMAQQERKYIREGNDLFEKQDFEKAEVEYRKAADQKAGSFEAAFNMADALYKQKKYEEALQQFSALAKEETNKERLGELYHNIGNTLLAMQKTEESIEAYKESLRNRPNAEPTKYNLEFARLKQQQQQDQNKDQQDQNKDQNDQNKDQQDQNKDQKDQQNKDQKDQQDQNKDQKDQQNKDQQNKDQQNKDQQNKDQQGQQPQEGKISKEDAERLLEALQKDEKQVQEKVQKQKVQEQKAKKMKIEKDW